MIDGSWAGASSRMPFPNSGMGVLLLSALPLITSRFSLSISEPHSSIHSLAPAVVSPVPMKPSLISGGCRPPMFFPKGPNSASPVFESSCSKYEPNWSLGSARYSTLILIAVLLIAVEERHLPHRRLFSVDRGVVGNRKRGDPG